MIKTAIKILKHIGKWLGNAFETVVCIICVPAMVLYVQWCWKHHPEMFNDFCGEDDWV